MATVKGPLFSMDASGSLAGSIVFSKWRGRNYVRRHAVPSNPKSAMQVGTRAMLRYLSQNWDAIGASPKATWSESAESLAISPFNRYVGVNMDRWTLFKAPTTFYPAAEILTPGTLANGVVTAEILSIKVEVDVTVLANNWGIAIFRKIGSSPGESRGECVRIILGDSAATFTWVDIDVEVGSDYYYDATPFTNDGLLGTSVPLGNAVAAE